MACFFKSLSREAVKDMELGNPFLRMKLFPLFGVENKALTLEDVPQEFRPYPGCIFDVLSEPDKDKRREGMVQFFATLCNEECPTRKFSLFYTVMHCWKAVFAVSMNHPPQRNILRTFEWMTECGMFQSLMRILQLCLDQEFLRIEYNRYVPFRILESFFGAMQAEMVNGDDLIKYIIEDLDIALPTFISIMEGKITFLEQIVGQQVIGNFSCYPRGMILLVDAPKLAGLTGKYLWIAYDLCWMHYQQYDERKLAVHRYLLNTDIPLAPVGKLYMPGPNRSPDLCAYSALCCMCNICAGFPDECGMDKVDDCLVALVNEGYYWNLGTIATGIHLSMPKYSELTIDKFLSLTSWSCFNHINQKKVLNQLFSLPASRQEDPLMFFPRSKYRGRSVIAFLITHALWLDFDHGTHFSILGLMYLLKEVPAVGKAVVDVIGPQLVDLAHSIHHVKLPGDGDPMAVKRGIFEPILRLTGQPYYSEQGDYIAGSTLTAMYREDQWPECVLEIREFCLRHIREIKQKKEDKESSVLVADALKAEGNSFYGKGELEAAIECYTRALDTCPLKCTERRVTYHSNRAECFLQTNQPKKAIRDCNRALAMNPFNMKVRWRRSQAFQRVGYKYPAALDLLTIQSKKEDALKILGQKAYDELETTIFNLLDQQTYKTAASHKYSNRVHNDTIQRTASVKVDELERCLVPPYRGKSLRKALGGSPGGFKIEYESEEEEDMDEMEMALVKREEEKGGARRREDRLIELEEDELLMEQDLMRRKWLYRESLYKDPVDNVLMEREWRDQRKMQAVLHKEKREREWEEEERRERERRREKEREREKTGGEGRVADKNAAGDKESKDRDGEKEEREKEKGDAAKNESDDKDKETGKDSNGARGSENTKSNGDSEEDDDSEAEAERMVRREDGEKEEMMKELLLALRRGGGGGGGDEARKD